MRRSMKSGHIALVAVAVLALIGPAFLVVAQLQPEPPPPEPIAVWVCDHCGATERAPLENRSPDCSHCSEGQMVQRVYFRCPACGAVFEAYQVNWSPKAGRAADCRKEADAHASLGRVVAPHDGVRDERMHVGAVWVGHVRDEIRKQPVRDRVQATTPDQVEAREDRRAFAIEDLTQCGGR